VRAGTAVPTASRVPFLFCLKDSIQMWQLIGTGTTLAPTGWTRDGNGTFTATGVNAQLGIYQKLGTRNEGVMSTSDAY
jgi:hypothetical protein